MDQDRLNLRWDYDEVRAILSEDHTEIDNLIAAVRGRHNVYQTDVEERTDLLNQYARLPHLSTNLRRGSAPEYGPDVMSSRFGEILVTFYTQELRDDNSGNKGIEEDPEDDGSPTKYGRRALDGCFAGDESPQPAQGSFCQDRTPSFFAIPLQYLFRVERGGKGLGEKNLVMDFSKIPLKPISAPRLEHKRLRIIEFPTTYYAEEFFETMKNREIKYPENPTSRQISEIEESRRVMKSLSLKRLINNPKVAMIKLRDHKDSRFLAGVSYHPNMPRYKSLSDPKVKRASFLPGTVLFVAIPYLGLERISRVSFRKKPGKAIRHHTLLPGEEQTAFHLTNNLASSSISTLSLFEYNFPRKRSTALFDKTQTKIGENLMVVHQAWFTVFDNETIAAFRTANDNQVEHVPLSPHHHSFGAYHTLINMIDNILPSWELTLLDDIRGEISELEYEMTESGGVNGLTDLIDILYTMRTELSTIVTVVDLQMTILRRLKQFHLESEQEQFKVMRKAIEKVIKSRRVFQQEVESMINRLKDLQIAKQDRLKYQMMINTARMQEFTGLTLEELAYQQAEVQKVQQQLQVKQDVRMTVFTSVTVVFLPLSFFTSYFGMNVTGIRDTSWSQKSFWATCAPISLFITIFVLLVALRSKGRNEFTKRLNHIIECCTPRWLNRNLGSRKVDLPTITVESSSTVPFAGLDLGNKDSIMIEDLPYRERRASMHSIAAHRLSRTHPLSPTTLNFPSSPAGMHFPRSPVAMNFDIEKRYLGDLPLRGDRGNL